MIAEFQKLIASIPGSDGTNEDDPVVQKFRTFWYPKITQITEEYLGKGKKISQCNENQKEAIAMIIDDLKDLIASN